MKNIDKNLVVKANALIESRDKLPHNCRYILGYIISLVNPLEDKRFKEVRLTIQDIATLLEIDVNGLYKEIHRIIATLQGAVVKMKSTKNNKYITYNWFYTCEYNLDTGEIVFRLHDKLNPFLLDMKEEYTRYRLVITKNFTSMYSTRVYEFIKRFQYQKKFALSLNDIKECFECEQYKTLNDLTKRVIKPSIEDINTKTDVKVEYELVKTGRAVSHIKFTVKPNPISKDSDGNVPLEGQLHIDAVVKENNNKAKDFRFACIRNINMKYIKELISQYGESTVIDAIKIFNESEEAKVVKRPLDYLRGILNNISKEKTSTTKTLNFNDYEQRPTELIEKQVEELEEQQFQNIDMAKVSKRANEALERIKQKDN